MFQWHVSMGRKRCITKIVNTRRTDTLYENCGACFERVSAEYARIGCAVAIFYCIPRARARRMWPRAFHGVSEANAMSQTSPDIQKPKMNARCAFAQYTDVSIAEDDSATLSLIFRVLSRGAWARRRQMWPLGEISRAAEKTNYISISCSYANILDFNQVWTIELSLVKLSGDK